MSDELREQNEELQILYAVTEEKWLKAKERIAELTEELEDWRDNACRVLAEECAPDEMHCSCVPVLRRRIAELEAALAAKDDDHE